MKLVIAKDVK